MAEFNFEKTIERDIDRIICEEFYSSPEFLDLFLSKIGAAKGMLLSVEHSKWDEVEGRRSETDIEVRYQDEKGIHGILIEDKITADPQPEQAEGYRKRGDMHVSENSYMDYKTFLVAPQRYLDNPINNADKYDYNLSHEDLAEYFNNASDKHNQFCYICLSRSISKQRHSKSQLSRDYDSTIYQWFTLYMDYLEESNFENLLRENVDLPEGNKKPNWVHYNTSNPNLFIEHKIDQGKIELHFKGCTFDDVENINKLVRPFADKINGLIGKYDIGRELNSDNRIVLVVKKYPKLKIVDSGKANLTFLRDNKPLFFSMFKMISLMYTLVDKIKYFDFKK